MRAIWNGRVIADSDQTVRIEGNHYFPPESVDWDALAASRTTSRCWWKGKATYFHVQADGDVNPNAAWTYPKPWRLARRITDHVAFWRGVSITP
jgi:uncharacterized protein (DUF427 family)